MRNKKKSLIDDWLNKSVYLRMLIHFYGDLHQPLHNVSLVNEQFPQGDQGGNLFKIDLPGFKDLHTFWDACLGNYEDIRCPLDQTKFDKIDRIARKVMAKFPRGDKDVETRLKVTSVKEMSVEGVKFAIDRVYKGLTYGEAPSDDYIERPGIHRRATRGGRLPVGRRPDLALFG